MNGPNADPRAERLDALAAQYVREGYAVTLAPSDAQIPFDLDGYCPDLLARKNGAGLIVEVRTSASRIPVDRLQQVAEDVSRHPGWRFLLVTLDDIDSETIPAALGDLPDWPGLAEKLKLVRSLAGNGMLEPAFLYLWTVFETALRRRAIILQIPIERLPARPLLRHLYSHGEIPIEQIDLFQEFLGKYSRIAHGWNEPIDAGYVQTIAAAVGRLLDDWQENATAKVA